MSFRPLRTCRFGVEYAAALLGCTLLRLLPHRALWPLAAIGGAAIYAVPRNRRLILANLAVAFPEMSEAERRRLARRNVAAMMLTFLEFIWFVGRPRALAARMPFPALCQDMANNCRATGQALIWATPHLGNWELAGLRFRDETGMPFAVVVRPFNNPWLDRMIRRGRESVGTRVIPDKGAVRGVMRAIREGFHFATLVDQNTRIRDGGIFVDFFGLPVPTSRAPALFARKLNALVAVGGSIRRGRQYEIFIRQLSRPAADYHDDAELIAELMRSTEDMVRDHPEQYLWMYERWRYIPADATPEVAAKFPYYAIPAPPRFYDGNAAKPSS